MRKPISIVFGATSGLCALGVLGVWVRSYSLMDGVYSIANSGERHWSVQSAHGILELVIATSTSGTQASSGSTWAYQSWPHGRLMFQSMQTTTATRLGFRFERLGLLGGASPGHVVNLPHWFPLVLFSAYPVWAISRWFLRRKKIRAGRCVGCAYNLKGNVSGICPECGRNTNPIHSSGYVSFISAVPTAL